MGTKKLVFLSKLLKEQNDETIELLLQRLIGFWCVYYTCFIRGLKFHSDGGFRSQLG